MRGGGATIKLGYIPVLNRDKHDEGNIIRLFNEAGYHFQWITLKNAEAVDAIEVDDMGEGVEALVVGNEGDTESEQSDMGNVEVGEVDTKSGKSDVGNVKGGEGGTESGKSDVGNVEGVREVLWKIKYQTWHQHES